MDFQQIDQKIKTFDQRREIAIPGDTEETITFCTEHFIAVVNDAIKTKDKAFVALSGGSTPKAIFKKLSSEEYSAKVDWKKVYLFWSDERSVPPTDPDSNYKMAMDAGFNTLPIPKEHIFRMPSDKEDLTHAAEEYEGLILRLVPQASFDLVMLGMGEDGHTASLFPATHGLHVEERLVIANFVPQKNTWRLTFTFDAINIAHHVAIYVLGQSKADMVKTVLNGTYNPDHYPIQRIGTVQHQALWIVDSGAAEKLKF